MTNLTVSSADKNISSYITVSLSTGTVDLPTKYARGAPPHRLGQRVMVIGGPKFASKGKVIRIDSDDGIYFAELEDGSFESFPEDLLTVWDA